MRGQNQSAGEGYKDAYKVAMLYFRAEMPRVIDPAIKAIPIRTCTTTPTPPKNIPVKTDPSRTKIPRINRIIEKKTWKNLFTQKSVAAEGEKINVWSIMPEILIELRVG